MISFNYENDFELQNEDQISNWISKVILSENKKEGDINYIFCDDEYLLNLKPLAVQVSITSLLASAALRHKSLLFSGLNNGLAAYKAARAFNAKAA